MAFTVGEGGQGGVDLNSDGDASDFVLHVHDLRRHVTRNLGLAVTSDLDVAGRRVGFLVDEAGNGGLDRNGDGDSSDTVFALYDADSNSITNLQLAGLTLDLGTDLAALNVSEVQQGLADANGDGDSIDLVLFVHDIAAGTTTNTGRPTDSTTSTVVEPGFVGFSVPEDDQGFGDLNGDGDTSDYVVHVYSRSTGLAISLGLDSPSSAFRSSGTLFAFGVGEIGQGSTDLNGDGDTVDGGVLHLYDHALQSTTNLGLSVGPNPVVVLLDSVALRVSESSQGEVDLNGDGDTLDEVLHLHDAPSGLTVNTGFAAEQDIALTSTLLAFRIRESAQGATDLNGDGDAFDLGVAHLWDLATGTSTNLGLEGSQLRADLNLVAMVVRESGQNATDLNGDGDATDNVVHLHDALAGTTDNLAKTSHLLDLAGGVLAFTVNEIGQGGSDLNGDGDVSDNVLHQYFPKLGYSVNYGLPCFAPLICGGGVAFEVNESFHGFSDLNGDDDKGDNVMHVVTTR